MKNKNLFVPLEIAKKLKEKGFDKLCYAKYSEVGYEMWELITIDAHSTEGGRGLVSNLNFITISSASAPIYQQVIDWFEENHKIIVGYELSSYSLRSFKKNGNPSYKFKTKVFSFINGEEGGLKDFDSKIDALNEAILHGLSLIK